MKILNLILKGKWYDTIAGGEKREYWGDVDSSEHNIDTMTPNVDSLEAPQTEPTDAHLNIPAK